MRTTVWVAIALISAIRLSAQDSTVVNAHFGTAAPGHPYRDPHKARVLASVFPGAGYLYTGEYIRGYATYLTAIGGIGMGPVIFDSNSCSLNFDFFSSCKPGPTWPYKVAGIAMVASGAWAWFSGARDAPRSAERANARHHDAALQLKPVIQPAHGGRSGVNAGLLLDW